MAHQKSDSDSRRRDNSEVFETMLATTLDGFWLVDAKGRLLDVNSTYARLSGYSLDELLQMQVNDLEAKGSVEKFFDHVQNIIKEGADLFQSLHRRKDGSLWPVEVSCSYLAARGGQFIVFLRDVTKRKRVEKVLQEREQFYYANFSSNAAIMLLIDYDDGSIIAANDSAVDFYGYPRERLLAMRITDINLLPSEITKENWRSVPTDRGKRFEFRHRLAGGSVRNVEVSSTQIQFRGRTVLHSIVFDITERKRVEASLRKSEMIFAKFMEFSPIYVFFKDSQIRSLQLSKNYESLLGKPLDQLLGKTMLELFPSALAKQMVEDDLRILNEGKVFSVEEKFDGRIYHTIKFPIHIDGIPQYLAGFTIDITDQKRTEEALLAAKTAAEDALKARTAFLDIAAHELRTPVTAFSLLLQIVQRQIDKGQPLDATMLARLRNPVDRLTHLVVDLLDVSRLERGLLVLNPVRCDVINLISKCVEEFQFQAPERHFAFIKSEQQVEMDIDPVRIHQALSNLIDNAVKYTPENSPIEVSVDVMPTVIRVTVTDHGDGIPKEELSKVFDPFARGSSGLVIRAGGLGLGLVICRLIVELHGGTIQAASKLGTGSTFSFELPRKPATP